MAKYSPTICSESNGGDEKVKKKTVYGNSLEDLGWVDCKNSFNSCFVVFMNKGKRDKEWVKADNERWKDFSG